jgi:DNA invertase Pin-like site-specific DNA recombinase
MTATAYSYSRFSKPSQAEGDSLRRQITLRDAWVDRNAVVLDTSLTLSDEGVSAFRGDHRNGDRCALGGFLALVRAGRIPVGSFLIVESLDRLSREDIMPALSLLLELIQAGIKVVQLLPAEMTYDDKSNPIALMMAIMELNRGHAESAMKSERCGEAWRAKKRRAAEPGHAPLTARVPAWLRLVDGRLEAIESAAEAVRRVYALAAAGFGLSIIVRRLNGEGIPPIGRAKHWARSYVGLLLTSRAVVGEYQPCSGSGSKRQPDGEPIPGYYPPVVTEAEWYAARAALADRQKRPGRLPNRHINIFSCLLRDALDGGAIHEEARGASRRRLTSYGAARGLDGPHCAPFSATVFEAAILSRLREIDPAEVLPKRDRGADKSLLLAGRLAELDGEIEKVKARLMSRYSDALADIVERHEGERKALVEQLAEARQEAASPLGEAWGTLPTLLDALAAAPDPEEARVRLRAALRRVVEGAWCVFVARGARRLAAVQIQLIGGARRHYLILHRPATGGAVGSRPGGWSAKSVKLRRGLDLRDRACALDYAETLKGLDIDDLEAALA